MAEKPSSTSVCAHPLLNVCSTLCQAITTINTTAKWGAKVVYGDTDSLFISLEGKTKEQAFRLGNEMADAITAMNPRPVKLKFEKVS